MVSDDGTLIATIPMGSIRIERLVLQTDRRGLAIMPTPAIRITITDEEGKSQQFDASASDARLLAAKMLQLAGDMDRETWTEEKVG